MPCFTIADRGFSLHLIAGLNERAREVTHSITGVRPCSMSTNSRARMRRMQLIDGDNAAAVSFAVVGAPPFKLRERQLCIGRKPFGAAANVFINAGYDPSLPIAGRPAEANFDTLTSTIGEAAKWTIEESGTVSPLFEAGRRP